MLLHLTRVPAHPELDVSIHSQDSFKKIMKFVVNLLFKYDQTQSVLNWVQKPMTYG